MRASVALMSPDLCASDSKMNSHAQMRVSGSCSCLVAATVAKVVVWLAHACEWMCGLALNKVAFVALSVVLTIAFVSTTHEISVPHKCTRADSIYLVRLRCRHVTRCQLSSHRRQVRRQHGSNIMAAKHLA